MNIGTHLITTPTSATHTKIGTHMKRHHMWVPIFVKVLINAQCNQMGAYIHECLFCVYPNWPYQPLRSVDFFSWVCKFLKIVHCLDGIKFQNYLSFCKNQHPRTQSYHSLHLLTCASRVNPYRYSFFVNAPFIWNALARLNLVYTLFCYLQVIVDKSFLLSMFLVFLSFVPLCKEEHYYRIFLLCTLHRAKLIQFNSIQFNSTGVNLLLRLFQT